MCQRDDPRYEEEPPRKIGRREDEPDSPDGVADERSDEMPTREPRRNELRWGKAGAWRRNARNSPRQGASGSREHAAAPDARGVPNSESALSASARAVALAVDRPRRDPQCPRQARAVIHASLGPPQVICLDLLEWEQFRDREAGFGGCSG